MEIENIIILGIVIVVAFLVIRFVTKVLAKVIAFLIVAAVVVYFLFYWDGGFISIGKKEFILYELEEKYCSEDGDNIKCECMIKPLLEDIRSKYTEEEIKSIGKDNRETIKILRKSIQENREVIRECYQENKTNNSMKENLEDFKDKRIKKLFEDILEEEEPVKDIAGI